MGIPVRRVCSDARAGNPDEFCLLRHMTASVWPNVCHLALGSPLERERLGTLFLQLHCTAFGGPVSGGSPVPVFQ